jgi:hypothetical protein
VFGHAAQHLQGKSKSCWPGDSSMSIDRILAGQDGNFCMAIF